MQQVAFERTQPSVPTDKTGVGQQLLHAVVVTHESFLGLGVEPPTPDWGLMLSTLRQAIYVQPCVCALPGLAIFITSLSFNLVSDGLRQALRAHMNLTEGAAVTAAAGLARGRPKLDTVPPGERAIAGAEFNQCSRSAVSRSTFHSRRTIQSAHRQRACR